MKNALKPVRKSTWRSSLELEYLDETSVVKQEQMEKYHRIIGKKLSQFNDYASKEKIGQVHVAGFLHDAVAQNPDGSATSPELMSNDQRKRRITAVWMKKLQLPVHGRGAKKDVLQHRLVFSMSGELYARCIQAGVNPDRVLHHSMKRVMRKFQEKFHPGDRISYAYGFHHDTDNPHVHVALCPRTARNKYVGYSKPRFSHNPSQQRDHYTFVQQSFETECQRWGETLSTPQKISKLKSQRECEQFFFHQRSARTFIAKVQQTRPQSVRTISEIGLTLFRIKGEIEELENIRKLERMARLVSYCFGLKPLGPRFSLMKSFPKVGKSVRAMRLKKLRENYFRLRSLHRSELNTQKSHYHEQSAANTQANYRRCQESHSKRVGQRVGISH